MCQKIWIKELVKNKVANFDEPEPMEVEEPIQHEAIPYIEMDVPIGYLEEINWIVYDDEAYEVSSIETI